MWHNRFSEKENVGVRYICHDIKIPGPKSYLFLATLWAKLLIITVNFGNKSKMFSENFG